MMDLLIGNYLNVLGFKVFIIVLFVGAVVELLVTASNRMKRSKSPFKAPRFGFVLIVIIATILVHFRNSNFELIHLNYGILDQLLTYLFDLPVLAIVVVMYARVLTVISFIIVSLAFELSPTVNKIKVLRKYFADWSLKRSLLRV